MIKKKITYGGKEWCSVGDAARYLRTSATKVREFMGDGRLDYTQIRKNGNLYVLVTDLVKIQTAKLYPGGKRPISPKAY